MYVEETNKALVGATLDRQPPSITERLNRERDALLKRLKQIEGVLEQMSQNPEASALVDALAKLGHLPY